MAGKRMIHDKICESRKVNSVSFYAEALWIRIITKADDNGNYWREPFRIHANCMFEKDEATPDETSVAVKELIKAGLLLPYTADGRGYVHVSNFHDYQELRGDRNAQVEHPLHPIEMGGAYIGEGLRRDVWRDQSEREKKPSGNQVVATLAQEPEPIETPEVEVKDQIKVQVEVERPTTVTESGEPQEDLGDWSEFGRDFHRHAGGVKTFMKFGPNTERYQELCRKHGSDKVHSAIPTWVEIKGGKQKTKKSQWAAKNFLEEVEGLIEEGAAEEETDEVARVANGNRGIAPEFMR